MQRSFMQIYVEGSDQAIVFYQTAFDATVVASYPNADGTFLHAELDIQGQILALTERKSEYAIGGATNTGNTMQYCLEFGEGHEEDVKKAYDILKEDAHILIQLAPCEYSPLMADLIDKYGIRWCLFV